MPKLNTTMATGTIAGHHTEFTPIHREGNPTPVAFEVTMTVPMSTEDIVAALWVTLNSGYTMADLLNPPCPRFAAQAIVLETLLAEGARVQEALVEIPEVRPGTEEGALLAQLRAFVAEQFPTPAPAACPAPRPARRRTARPLAGVSA
jgi:hypothetical protein